MTFPHLGARGLAVLLLGSTLVTAAFGLRDPALFAPGVALIALLLGAGLVVAFGRPQWNVERRIVPDELERDDEAQMELTLRRGWGLPLIGLLDDPGEALGARVRLAPPRGRIGSLRYPVQAQRRGVHAVDRLTWSSADPLGLWTASGRLRSPASVTVWPRVQAWDDTALAALSDRVLRRPTTEVDDSLVREYRPGDDPRRIHWRSTARTGATMVRREQQADDPWVTILIDTRAGSEQAKGAGSMRKVGSGGAVGGEASADRTRREPPTGSVEPAERAIEAAASAAVALLRAGIGVRIVAADGAQVASLAPSSAPTQRAGCVPAPNERAALNALAALSVGAPGWDARVHAAVADLRIDETVLAALIRIDAETLVLLDAAPLPGVAVVLDDAEGSVAALEAHGWLVERWGPPPSTADRPKRQAGVAPVGASTSSERA